MVRQWQELLHGERYSESYMDALPDFVKLAEAVRRVGMRASKADAGRRHHGDDRNRRPVFFDMQVEKSENCFPMIPSGMPTTTCCWVPRTRRRSRFPKTAWSWSRRGSPRDTEARVASRRRCAFPWGPARGNDGK